MTSPVATPPGVHAAFRAAMRRFASTVTVVTACDHARRHGMTATAVTSLSMEPPSLLVCIHRQTLLHDILLRAPRFCVNVLHSSQGHVSAAFSGGVPPERRFDGDEWQNSEDGVPFLRGAQANLFCRKAAAVPYGTHLILVGEVEKAELCEGSSPLLYHDAGYCVTAPAA
ncbi:flavin reductase family protein [Roseomonas gilardii]|uniref:flavin reductase family protein n=1 Tax=Roseomonas gilardii TaxID=257708 RepID=UPI000485D504|nr:flavin reductase family protein [Roseomonas gilardii]